MYSAFWIQDCIFSPISVYSIWQMFSKKTRPVSTALSEDFLGRKWTRFRGRSTMVRTESKLAEAFGRCVMKSIRPFSNIIPFCAGTSAYSNGAQCTYNQQFFIEIATTIKKEINFMYSVYSSSSHYVRYQEPIVCRNMYRHTNRISAYGIVRQKS